MRFEFATSARIAFGEGSLKRLPEFAKEFGTNALLVTGRDTKRSAPVMEMLATCGLRPRTYSVHGEPTLEAIRNGVAAATDCELVIGFGGGSAIDSAKAIGALATNSGEPLDYLEVIGRGQPFENPPLPVIAVPTTAGTGAEVTRNAVLGSPEHHLKASLRGPFLLPKAAVVDPSLTVDLPPQITASTGLDALTQLIEAYVTPRATAMTDLFCREGLIRMRESLLIAFRDGRNLTARADMSFASLLSGLALANAGLGVIHGFAAPLGGMLGASHGELCAAVLSHGMRRNIQALREREPNDPALSKYEDVARMLTQNSEAEPEDGVGWVADLCSQLGASRLATLGLDSHQIPELVEQVSRANSTKANPIPLRTEELSDIARSAL